MPIYGELWMCGLPVLTRYPYTSLLYFYPRELAKLRGYTSCFVVAVAVVVAVCMFARPLRIEAV
jgi:hypothetical protein